jgi:signal transduction histidine kinase
MISRLRHLSASDWRVIDRVLVGVVLVIAELEVAFSSTIEGPRVLNAILFGTITLSLLWRRSHAFLVLCVVLGGLLLGQLVLTAPPELFAAILMLLSAAYAGGRHLEGRRALVALGVAVASITTVAVIWDPDDIFFPVTFFCIVPWLVGRTLRNHTALARELAEKAEQAEHARAEDERRAIAAERSRIARELHDVLAHSLSVMVVQSGAARRIVARDPERAAQAAELVRETGREALAELRHLFGPVRRGEGEDLSGPPSIARVEQLAARARAAGLDVRVEVEGTPVELPPGVDLTAYRVVQEALTNTLKHAGSANAGVTVAYGATELAISIEDDGTPGAGALDESGGHGLLGMRERVALYGGEIEAGPRPGGGFAVSARLPIRPLVPA